MDCQAPVADKCIVTNTDLFILSDPDSAGGGPALSGG
jgi:hypothetical protein